MLNIESQQIVEMVTAVAVAANGFFTWRNNVLAKRTNVAAQVTQNKIQEVHDCVHAALGVTDNVATKSPPPQ